MKTKFIFLSILLIGSITTQAQWAQPGSGIVSWNGRVGIGTTGPQFLLDIYTETHGDGFNIQHSNGRWLRIFSPHLNGASYNNIVDTNDAAIIFGSAVGWNSY